MSAILGGGGGGKDDFAQGGGTNLTAVASAFAESKNHLSTLA
jgi:alanyl-tRNA synthetase